jgi:hypothetical protein
MIRCGLQFKRLTRRELVALLGGMAAAPLIIRPEGLRAQPAGVPVIGFMSFRSPEESAQP